MVSLSRLLYGLTLLLLLTGAALRAAEPGEHAPHDKAEHAPDGKAPVYEVDGHDDAGHSITKVLDLSKPEDAAELHHLIETGHAHEVLIKQAPPLSKIGSLAIDLGIWTLVIFGLLFFILKQKAWPMMLEGLTRREQSIRSAVEEAQTAREETAKLRDEVARERQAAAQEARALIDAARVDAQKLGDELRKKAMADIQAERDRLRRDMELARDSAVQELWAKTTELATLVSSRAIGRQMNADDHRHLVDEAIAEIKQAGAQRKREMASV